LAGRGIRLVAKGVYTAYLVQSLTSASSEKERPALPRNGEHH